MKADTWSFRAINLLIAASASGVLWWLFADFVNDLLFLVPLYWIMHVRDNVSRLRELSDRVKIATEVIAELVDDPNNLLYEYEETLERHGFYDDAEEWNEKHPAAPRT